MENVETTWTKVDPKVSTRTSTRSTSSVVLWWLDSNQIYLKILTMKMTIEIQSPDLNEFFYSFFLNKNLVATWTLVQAKSTPINVLAKFMSQQSFLNENWKKNLDHQDGIWNLSTTFIQFGFVFFHDQNLVDIWTKT